MLLLGFDPLSGAALSEAPQDRVAWAGQATLTVDWELRLFAATHEYHSRVTDDPPDQPFLGTLQKAFRMDRSVVGTSRIGEELTIGVGEVVLSNLEGDYDALTTDASALGQEITVRYGHRHMPYRVWRTVLKGFLTEFVMDRDQVTFRIRDGGYRLDFPASPNLYLGTGDTEGTEDLKDKRKPRWFGWNYNVSPPLVIPSFLAYQLNDGPIEEVLAVYVRGAALVASYDYATVALMNAATLSVGEYATCLDEGWIRIAVAGGTELGAVTCDFAGDKTGTVFVDTAADIVRRLIGTATEVVDPDDLVVTTFDQLNATQPAAIGYGIPVGSEETVSTAVARIMASIGGWCGANRVGKFLVNRFEDPGQSIDSTYEFAEPDGNDEFTRVMLHCDGLDGRLANTILDNSFSTQHVWTFAGNAGLSNAVYKFGNASLFVDGTGDEITTPDSADFTLGSSDFTVDCWINVDASGAGTDRYFCGSGTGAAAASSFYFRVSTATQGLTAAVFQAGVELPISGNTALTTGVWHHVTFIRNGGFLHLYLDGTEDATPVAIAGSVNDSATVFTVGGWGSVGSNRFFGHIDEFRLSVGIAHWTANFVPPTTRHGGSVDDYTYDKILLHFDTQQVIIDDNKGGSGIVDSNTGGSPHLWTLQGNAHLSDTSSVTGNASLALDGSGDWVSTPLHTDFTIGSSDFTIDFWLNLQNAAAAFNINLAGQYTGVPATSGWYLYRAVSEVLVFGWSNGVSFFDIQIGVETYTDVDNPGWHHIAITQSGGTLYLFVDGVLKNSYGSFDSINLGTEPLSVGSFAGASNGVNGFIDEFRLSVGIARWTASFTPPTQVTSDEFTRVLLHFDFTNSGFSRVWNAFGGCAPDTAQFKFGISSLLFDGTDDYVTTPAHTDFALADNDFTIDCWFRCNTPVGTNPDIAGQNDAVSTVTNRSFNIDRNAVGQMAGRVIVGSTTFTVTGTTLFSDTDNPGWHHLAFVRTGNILRLFIDGVQEGGDVAVSGSVNFSQYALSVGRDGERDVVGAYWVGWIDEFRISIGIARWIADFTPPTQPYTHNLDRNDDYTMVLLHGNGTDTTQVFPDTNFGGYAHTWTFTGNAQIDTAQSRFGGASMLFDGTGDYISTPASSDVALVGNDFTIEFWLRPNGAVGSFNLAGQTNAGYTTQSWGIWINNGRIQAEVTTTGAAAGVVPLISHSRFSTSDNLGWHHIAFVRSGSTLMLFIDGVMEDYKPITGSVFVSSNTIAVGVLGEDTNVPLPGWVDEFHISVGIARWTENFAPPVRENIDSLLVSSLASISARYDRTNLVDVGLAPLPDSLVPPPWRVRIGYARNWTIQTDLAGSVSAEYRAFVAEEQRFIAAENNDTRLNFPPGNELVVPGYFVESVDAELEAIRRLSLYGATGRALYVFKLCEPLFVHELGDIVHLQFDDRFDLDGGKLVRIVKIVEDDRDGVELTAFG